MTTTAIKERLYDYIRVADDKKIAAIYTFLEGEIVPKYDWSADEEFVAELDERVKRWEDDIDEAYTVKTFNLNVSLDTITPIPC